MALQSAISGANLTAIRSDNNYRVLQFLCTVPNDVVVQFQPSADLDNTFAEITVGTVASGSMSNIKAGQLVIFSTGTDYQATETFRTRVRKVSGTTVLYVGENSQDLNAVDYVTVIDTYEVVEKLRKSQTLLDYDLTFRKLLPIETALASAVVLSNDIVAYTPTASPIVMDADASSISTHAWESSNSNDSLDSGGTTASPSFTLEAGAFRWIRYTFTDDLGQSNYRVIPVWTVPKDYSSTVQLGFGSENGDFANISFDNELGWTVAITAFSGITSLLNNTFVVIASDEWYNNSRQSIRSNINFVGYLQNENVDTRTDEQHGRISETAFTIEGFGHQMARQNITSAYIERTVASASAWDEIKNPTPARMLTYRMTEFSTISNLCALSIPSDDTSFVGDDLVLDREKLLDDARFIAEVINAELQFDMDGTLDLCRDLNYLDSTARDAAATVVTLSPDDFIGNYSIEYDYTYTTSQVDMNGGSYDSTNDVYDLFEALAPITRYSNGDLVKISNQVLTTDNTLAQSQTEIAQRCSNYLAANNPTWTLRGQLKDEWHFLVPDNGAWFKFNIVAADTVRGKVFDSTDRWQLVSISINTNSLTGRRTVNVVFRHETDSTGASIRANQIVNSEDANINYVPAALPPYSGQDQSLTDGVFYDSIDVSYASENNPPPSGCETFGFRVTGSGVGSSPALNGEDVSITVRGRGLIYPGLDETESVSATTNPHAGGGATGITVSEGTNITFTATGTWTHDDGVVSPYSADGAGFTTGISVLPSANIGTLLGKVGSGGSWFLIGASNTVAMPASGELYLGFNDDPAPAYGDNSGSVSVDITSPEVNGDAFYEIAEDGGSSAYDSGEGLLIEGSQPASIPPYNPNNEYTVYDNVNSGPVSFSYNSPYSISLAENWSIQVLICFLGVP